MKKFMLFATAVGLTLTSCVNDEETTMMGSRSVIAFDAPAMKTSRANQKGEITGVQYPTNEQFKVFSKIYTNSYKGWAASENIADYFAEAGDEAKHEGGTYWSTQTIYYWPDAGYNLAFAAYSPAKLGAAAQATTITRTDAGIQIDDFVSEEESDKQYDLMYSHTVYDRNKSNNAASAVSLKFEHALSSIVFSSQKSDEAAQYRITDLMVTGDFITKGDFNQGITSTTSGGAYTENENPQWDTKNETPTAVQYEPTFKDFNVPVAAPEIFTQGTSAILAIPQGVPTDAKVHVTYEKTTNKGLTTETTTTHTAEIFLKDFKKATAEGTAVADSIVAWERGKRYVYRIAFGQNQRIYFEPSVADWVQEPTLIYTIQ
jgi:hypothetical protein